MVAVGGTAKEASSFTTSDNSVPSLVLREVLPSVVVIGSSNGVIERDEVSVEVG